jgi:hypothetical protein
MNKDLANFLNPSSKLKKTIAKPYLFKVSFPSSVELTAATNQTVADFGISEDLYESFKKYTNAFLADIDIIGSEYLESFNLKPYSVKGVNIPNFAFGKEKINVGPFSKSLVNMNFDGYELNIDIAESEDYAITRFMTWLKARQVHKNGWFWPEKLAVLPWIEIDIYKSHDSEQRVLTYKYEDVTFLTSSEAQYTYSDNEPIAYSLTFNANSLVMDWHNG